MKIRNGFVSNSSSSSFVIIKEDKTLSKEELIKRSMEVYGDGDDEYYNKKAEKLANKGKFVLAVQNIDYGAEDAVEELARKLCEVGNIKDVSFVWED